MNYPPRSVLYTAAVALFACWFIYTRPLAALAIGVVCLVTLGVVGFVASVGWVVFGWGTGPVDAVELPDDGFEAAHDDANRWS